ncbi:hypothetical protein D3C87_1942510 [compost metagenome]
MLDHGVQPKDVLYLQGHPYPTTAAGVCFVDAESFYKDRYGFLWERFVRPRDHHLKKYLHHRDSPRSRYHKNGL